MTYTANNKLILIKEISGALNHWSSRIDVLEKEVHLFLENLKVMAEINNSFGFIRMIEEKQKEISKSSEAIWLDIKWGALLDELMSFTGGNVINEEETKELIAATIEPQENNVVLVIDNDIMLLTSVKEKLEANGYHVLIALNMKIGMNLFYMMRPIFVAIDIDFTKVNEHKFLVEMTNATQKNFTPIIVMSEREFTKEHQIEAYKIGVTAYIPKPLDLDIFTAYLDNRVQLKERIHKMVLIDELTETYNRKHMYMILNNALTDFRRYGVTFTVVMLDLDFFKKINDQYGHLAGDMVLRKFAEIIKSLKRESDYLFRYGGEEFLLYLRNTSIEGTVETIGRIRNVFNSYVFTYQGSQFHVTFSAGISSTLDLDVTSEILIDEADKALYISKENGRNTTTVYSEESSEFQEEILHVIIIDENQSTRTLLKNAFLSWELDQDISIVVHAYEDGMEFLYSDWYICKDKYLILLDDMMSKIDGIEVLEKLRSTYPIDNIVVSMLSSRTEEEKAVIAIEKGADDYFLKPLNEKKVLTRCQRLIKRIVF